MNCSKDINAFISLFASDKIRNSITNKINLLRIIW